jgi:hypothetical protein
MSDLRTGFCMVSSFKIRISSAYVFFIITMRNNCNPKVYRQLGCILYITIERDSWWTIRDAYEEGVWKKG